MVSRAAVVRMRPLPAVTRFCPKLTPVPWPPLELDPLSVLRWSFLFPCGDFSLDAQTLRVWKTDLDISSSFANGLILLSKVNWKLKAN